MCVSSNVSETSVLLGFSELFQRLTKNGVTLKNYRVKKRIVRNIHAYGGNHTTRQIMFRINNEQCIVFIYCNEPGCFEWVTTKDNHLFWFLLDKCLKMIISLLHGTRQTDKTYNIRK